MKQGNIKSKNKKNIQISTYITTQNHKQDSTKISFMLSKYIRELRYFNKLNRLM